LEIPPAEKSKKSRSDHFPEAFFKGVQTHLCPNFAGFFTMNNWLVVSTPLKNISQLG
jgi:hypothetical protein